MEENIKTICATLVALALIGGGAYSCERGNERRHEQRMTCLAQGGVYLEQGKGADICLPRGTSYHSKVK